MAVMASTAGLDREAWLQLRRRGIGGSDAPAIAGVDPFKSPIQVYCEKTGEVEPAEPGEAAHWGRVLEDVIAAEFGRRTGFDVRRRNAILQHNRHRFMIANLDRTVRDADGPALLEIKTAGFHSRNEWDEDRLPERVIIQVQHYLAVTGYRRGYVAALIAGQKYVQAVVERDDELIRHLIEIEAGFWTRVERREPDPSWIDGSDASAETLKVMYPEAEAGKVAILPLEAEDLIRQYRAAAAAEKEAGRVKEEAANRLKALLGDAEEGFLAGERVVIWKNVESTRLDTSLLKANQPELYDRYAKKHVARRFTVKGGE